MHTDGPLSEAGRRRGLAASDGVALAGLLALVAGYAWTSVGFAAYPEEDAAMLLRYAKHLGEGHGIVWNVGEHPVDGATDFLFMLPVAILYRAGLSLEAAARAVGLASHGATALAIFLAGRTLFASRWLALLSAAYLASGVGVRYVAACYGTPLFALTTCLAWWLAQRLVLAGSGALRRASMLFSLSAVAMGLARPEGVFLAVFMLAGVLHARGREGARTLLASFVLVFLAIGLPYFLWRWSYFGHPLPNPFYKRSGGVLHWTALGKSFTNVLRLGGPFLAVLAAGLLSERTRRRALSTAIPVVSFTLLWVLVSDETNYFMRFRYPVLPLLLISWIPVWQGLAAFRGPGVLAHRPRLARAGAALAGLASLAAIVWAQHARYRHIEPQRIGLYDVAIMLRAYSHKGYCLATTEAGLLPLYSNWRAVDAWGLNDPWIARAGGVTEEYLDRYRPELIAFHAYDSPGASEPEERAARRGLGPSWFRMVRTLRLYAEGHGYALVAAFVKNPRSTHYYYLRLGFPDAPEIAERLRAMEYYLDSEPRRSALTPGGASGKPM